MDQAATIRRIQYSSSSKDWRHQIIFRSTDLPNVQMPAIKICIPDPRSGVNHSRRRGARKTSPCTSFHPTTSSWPSYTDHTDKMLRSIRYSRPLDCKVRYLCEGFATWWWPQSPSRTATALGSWWCCTNALAHPSCQCTCSNEFSRTMGWYSSKTSSTYSIQIHGPFYAIGILNRLLWLVGFDF